MSQPRTAPDPHLLIQQAHDLVGDRDPLASLLLPPLPRGVLDSDRCAPPPPTPAPASELEQQLRTAAGARSAEAPSGLDLPQILALECAGNLAWRRGDWHTAVADLHTAAADSEHLGDLALSGRLHAQSAELHVQIGEDGRALRDFFRAITLLRQAGELESAGRVETAMARYYLVRRRLVDGPMALHQANRTLTSINSPYLAVTHAWTSVLAQASGQNQKAQQEAHTARDLAHPGSAVAEQVDAVLAYPELLPGARMRAALRSLCGLVLGEQVHPVRTPLLTPCARRRLARVGVLLTAASCKAEDGVYREAADKLAQAEAVELHPEDPPWIPAAIATAEALTFVLAGTTVVAQLSYQRARRLHDAPGGDHPEIAAVLAELSAW